MTKPTHNRKENGRADIETGIYAIVHKASGKRYVGQAARTFALRRRSHAHQLRNGKHHSRYLQRAYNKYGADAFKWVVLERIDLSGKSGNAKIELLRKREQHWMDKTPPGLLLNSAPAAGSNLGVVYSEEVRTKMSANIRKHWADPKRRAEHLAAIRALTQSPEWIANNLASRRKLSTAEVCVTPAYRKWRREMSARITRKVDSEWGPILRDADHTRWQTPEEWHAKMLAANRKLAKDPKWIAAMRKVYASSEWRANVLAANRKLVKDPKWLANQRAAGRKRRTAAKCVTPAYRKWRREASARHAAAK